MTFIYYRDDGYVVEFPSGEIYHFERYSEMMDAIKQWSLLYCNTTRLM